MLGFITLDNARRAKEWPGNDEIDLAFRGLEAAGEAGELAEALKKLIRFDRNIVGNPRGATHKQLLSDVADEIGDVVISVSLIANMLGLDTGRCVESKFNETSKKHGLATRL